MSPHRCANNSPSCVPGFCQITTFTLCQSCPPAKWCRTLVFYLGVAVFPNPTLQRPLRHLPVLILWGRVSLPGGWCWLVAEDSGGNSHSSELMENCNTPLGPGFVALSQCLCSILVAGTVWWHPWGVLPEERPYHLSQMHSKAELLLPLWPWGSSGCPLLGLSSALPWESNTKGVRQAHLAMSQTSDTSESALCCLQKPGSTVVLSFSRQWFWAIVFLCSPLRVFSLFLPPMLFRSLLLSHIPSSVRAPSPREHPPSFSPTDQLSAVPIFHGLLFWFVEVQLCSLRLRLILGRSEWFGIYLAVFEWGGRLRVTVLLCNLTSLWWWGFRTLLSSNVSLEPETLTC